MINNILYYIMSLKDFLLKSLQFDDFMWHTSCSLPLSQNGLIMKPRSLMWVTEKKKTTTRHKIRKKKETATNKPGAPNVNFRKISVRKTIWDLEFSEHLL